MDNIENEDYSIGFLIIEVYGINEGSPIDKARVEITDTNDKNLIVETTNSLGKTTTLSLTAPNIIYSKEESYQPYFNYNLKVYKDNYEDYIVKGVQIYPNAIAIQKVFLTTSFKEIDIQEPTLWGDYPSKIEESEVKSLDKWTGLVVLPQIVIPEFIVVHEGIPSNKTALNRKVEWSTYIKNVASCEIYPNWPTETIKANVLAIISFALNRVYTEWYYSQGYSWNITNTSAYDQAFDYGRNIYKEIEIIVDELWTSFITKPNIKQPLFSQYCDGKKSTCPKRLSQWGSKELGDKGYKAIDILKHYYGQEVFIKDAEKVVGVPMSFKENLNDNSTGEMVSKIQEELNAIAKNYPLIGLIKVSGIYDEETKKAVKTFQEVFDLPITGVVDKATWYKISKIYIAVAKLAELT